MKQVIIRASQSDFGQVDFYSYLPEVKENGGCSTPDLWYFSDDKTITNNKNGFSYCSKTIQMTHHI